jgi:hypothetical protein
VLQRDEGAWPDRRTARGDRGPNVAVTGGRRHRRVARARFGQGRCDRAVKMGLTGGVLLQCRVAWVKRFEPFQNLNSSNKLKIFQTLTDPKNTFPCSKKFK